MESLDKNHNTSKHGAPPPSTTSNISPQKFQRSYSVSSSARHQQISSSSSTFVSASQSPFFSPRSPPSSSCNDSAAFSSESKYCPHSTTSNDAFSPQPMINRTTLPSGNIRPPPPLALTTNPEPAHKRKKPLLLNAYNPARKVSISRTCASLSSSARYRSCDVYIGTHGQKRSLLCFTKWLRAELEMQGIACFAADRARYVDSRSHDIADRAIGSSTFGVVIVTRKSFCNPYSIEELRIFLKRKNLVPLFFDLGPGDCLARDIIERRGELWERQGGDLWRLYGGDEREWKDAVEGLSRVSDEWRLEAHDGNWRDCIASAVSLLGSRLGRRSVAERERRRKVRFEGEECPFPRNGNFIGRKRELSELEGVLFGTRDEEEEEILDIKIRPRRKDSVIVRRRSRKRGFEKRRASESDRIQDGLEIGNDRRKSEADKWEAKSLASRKAFSKGKELEVWKEDEEEIEMQKGRRHRRHARTLHKARFVASKRNTDLNYGRGIACVTGEPGIGKTELVLEFAYRYAQRYRMVLWVGGETRYLRQNYFNLSLMLGLDLGSDAQISSEKGKSKTFEEQEMEALQRIKKELARDIPYLVVIDNLESERDWWDGRDLLELLPRFGGTTHVIISTRLQRVMNLDPLRISYLSSVEAMSLMKGNRRNLTVSELDVLRTIEERLGRSTLGLSIVGSILNELPIAPSRLLDTVNRVPLREILRTIEEESILRQQAFLVQLLDVCFSILDHADERKKFATRMVLAGAWFAPYPISLSLLAHAAQRLPQKRSRRRLWKKCWHVMGCFCRVSRSRRPEIEASSFLIRFGIARTSTKPGWIQLHQIVQLYARKKGGVSPAKAMFQGILTRGSVSQQPEHLWAACFLAFKFGNDTIVVQPRVCDLLVFIKRAVVPLALHCFSAFSRCQAATELLRVCTKALEGAEESFVSQVPSWLDKSSCWSRPQRNNSQLDEYMWQDVTLLKASLLEIRAKLMLKGGFYDVGEELCRSCISIRTVLLGSDHPDTMASQETLAKLVRYQTNIRVG